MAGREKENGRNRESGRNVVKTLVRAALMRKEGERWKEERRQSFSADRACCPR